MLRKLTRISGCLLPVAAVAMLASAGAAWADYPQIRLNTDTTQQLQNEEVICVNPTDPNNIVAAWRDFRLGYRQVGVGYSLDGGLTWTDYLIGGQLPWDSDPVLTVHRDGTFYLVVINYQDGGDNQISVHRSTTKGVSWEGPFTAVYSNGSTFEDKEWITVDRTAGPRDGTVYVSWSRFYDVKIMCVRSTDRGQTWTAPVQVSDPAVTAQWPVPLVLRNGNLLIAWTVYGSPKISYDISTNGGVSWGTDRTLSTTTTGPQDQINGGITVFPYPSLALDETNGTRAGWVYCLYTDKAVAANGMDAWFRRSTDGGNTWSNRLRVNNDPEGLNRDQFHPWLCCDEQGILTAIWYDRREDPGNYLWHIYMSRSLDGGFTWEPNVRITDVPSSPGDAAVSDGPDIVSLPEYGGIRAGLIGEYSGVSVRQGVIHPIWTDTRDGNQDAYTSVLRAPAGVVEILPGLAAASVRSYPNPAHGGSEFYLKLPDASGGSLTIHDASGRLVRSLPLADRAMGETRVRWDGRDDQGREMPAGVYLARVNGSAALEKISTKVVLTQ